MDISSNNLPQLSTMIMAVGALGAAAFGLVDAFKVLPGGGVSHFGFSYVKKLIDELIASEVKTGLSREKIRESLKSHWINGVAIADQVNIAKSLVKLQLTPESAPTLAKATGVDGEVLKQVAALMMAGKPLESQMQSDVYGRFDLALTTLLDQAYQRGEQRYRNSAKFAAVMVAVALSVIANEWVVPAASKLHTVGAVLLGLIATPIAPVAKDIASAIGTASKAIQAWKG